MQDLQWAPVSLVIQVINSSLAAGHFFWCFENKVSTSWQCFCAPHCSQRCPWTPHPCEPCYLHRMKLYSSVLAYVFLSWPKGDHGFSIVDTKSQHGFYSPAFPRCEFSWKANHMYHLARAGGRIYFGAERIESWMLCKDEKFIQIKKQRKLAAAPRWWGNGRFCAYFKNMWLTGTDLAVFYPSRSPK